MLFIAFYIAAKMSISDVSYISSQEHHIETISYRNRVFIIYIMYSGCCHVYSAVLYALAETHVVCVVTRASPF